MHPRKRHPSQGREPNCWWGHRFDSLGATDAIMVLVGQICWKCILYVARESYSWAEPHWMSFKRMPGRLQATLHSWLPQATGAGHQTRHRVWKSNDLMDPSPVSTLEHESFPSSQSTDTRSNHTRTVRPRKTTWHRPRKVWQNPGWVSYTSQGPKFL